MNDQVTPCRDSFVFYRSFHESIKRLPDEVQTALYRSIVEYALDQVVPDFTGISFQPFVEAIFAGIRPQLDANYKRFLNGCGGGCPPGTKKPSMMGNTNASKKQNRNETETKPNVNVNENENVEVVGKRVPDQELTMPFNDSEFVETWNELRQQPKWRNKTKKALQMSLKQLSKYDVRFGVWLMQNAIAGNYQGVVFDDTPARYDRWLQATTKTDQVATPVGTVVGNVNDLYND